MKNERFYRSNFNDSVLDELKAVLPSENVSVKKIDRIAVAHGVNVAEQKWILRGNYPFLPDVVVWPETAEEVSDIIKIANKYGTVVIPYGGGSGSVCGTVFYNGGICVDIKKLIKFEVNDINHTLTAGVGYNGMHLELELNRRGYTMGHYPQSINSSVVGGWVAPIAIGTFSTKYGKFDDILISLEAVLPTGEIIRTHPAPKASNGINLNHLFVGAEGSTGIVTEATMKIWPMPETRKYSVYTFDSTHNGIEAIRKIMHTGITPAVVRLYDEDESEEKIRAYGYEKGFAILFLGFEGRSDLVELELKISHECCIGEGGNFKGDQAGKDWEKTRYDTASGVLACKVPAGMHDCIEVGTTWDNLENVWLEMRNAMAPYAHILFVHFSHIYHTGAMLYLIFRRLSDGDTVTGEQDYYKCVKTSIDAAIKYGATISHHHGVGTLKSPWMEQHHGAGFDVMKKIKSALDPNNIMNPPALGLGGNAHVGEL